MPVKIAASELKLLRAAQHKVRVADAEVTAARADYHLSMLRLYAKYDQLQEDAHICLKTGTFKPRADTPDC